MTEAETIRTAAVCNSIHVVEGAEVRCDSLYPDEQVILALWRSESGLCTADTNSPLQHGDRIICRKCGKEYVVHGVWPNETGTCLPATSRAYEPAASQNPH
jgi:hypothetical protein